MSFWDKLLDWLGIAAKLPEFKQATRIYSDGNKVLKVNSVQHATCGYLVCTYNNSTRENSWIGLLSRGYRIIHTSPNETMGTPALVDGWWVFPAESKRREALVHVNDKTGEVRRGIKALDEYAAVCGEGGYIPYANPVRLCDPTGKVVRTWDNFNGIVSGIAKRGKEWVLAIMDGSAPGLVAVLGDLERLASVQDYGQGSRQPAQYHGHRHDHPAAVLGPGRRDQAGDGPGIQEPDGGAGHPRARHLSLQVPGQ